MKYLVSYKENIEAFKVDNGERSKISEERFSTEILERDFIDENSLKDLSSERNATLQKHFQKEFDNVSVVTVVLSFSRFNN